MQLKLLEANSQGVVMLSVFFMCCLFIVVGGLL
jgi:hypothetical protein